MTQNYQQQKCYQIFIIWLIIFLIGMLPGCEKKKPVKIGFAGSFSRQFSDMGIEGRNGVLLAIEQINKSGGIHGRPVELIVKDDQHDAKVAVQVDKELIAEGVVAIIGHMTSTMSMAVYPLINKEKIIMISPTSSTDELTGIDDYFFRITSASKTDSDQLARYAFKIMGLRKIRGLYDLSNQVYTEGYYRNFKTEFESMGGTLAPATTFISGKEVSYFKMAENLLDSDGVFILAGPIDTAMICQQLRKLDTKIPIIASGWAKKPDLLHHGGHTVEGVIFPQIFNEESMHKDYVRFKQQFIKRFGKKPNFVAAYSYEAAQLLFVALLKNRDPARLKDSILSQQIFSGLQGDIRMDKYGDRHRSGSLVTIRNNKFILIK
ncbi:branched-chain amino acid transport system substrate-binding protein [Candidatus Magnetomoraceae bacterium gMMP-13]